MELKNIWRVNEVAGLKCAVFKTKPIALGWKQRYNIDFSISFASVCRLDNQRQPVVIAAARDRKVISLDALPALQSSVLDQEELESISKHSGRQYTSSWGKVPS